MNHPGNTEEQVHVELAALRQRVAELEQAENSLRESEERFRQVFEDGPIGVLLVDTQGRLRHCNRRFCEMLGYSEDEILALGLAAISHPDDWERDYPFVSRLWRGEIPQYHVEKRYFRKDGQVIWGQLTVSLTRTEAGEPTNTIGMVEDITERKRAEEALKLARDELEEKVKERTAELSMAYEELRQGRDELQAIHDQALDGIIIVDSATNSPVRANAAFGRMLGYSEDEVRTISPERVHSPEVLPRVWEHIEAAQRHGIDRIYDLPFVRKDGKTIYADVVTSRIVYNRRPGWISCFHDVTQRKYAEEALRQSERHFRNYFEQGLIGMATTAPDGSWLEINDRICQILGYSKTELRETTWPELTHPEDLASDTAQFQLLLKGQIENYTLDKRFIRKDGSLVHTTIHIRAFRRDDGSLDHIVGLMEDITARREAEEALRKQHRSLKHLLQSSDHERQLIAYEIHDGLAQQLAGAIMQFQTFDALKDTKPKQAADAHHAGLTMLQQGHFETRRLIAGVRPPILDESGVVEAVAHLVHEQGREKGPKIDYRSRVDFDRLVPTLENAIYRICQEGLANACKHSKSKAVRVSLVQRQDRIRIEIRDWGVGFDLKRQQRNRFGIEGIRQRAKLLGGKCSIQSAAGKGTRIAVVLPVAERDSDE